MNLEKVKIYNNFNNKTKDIKKHLIDKLIANNFKIVEKDAQLVISIGGDGTFLKALRGENYNKNCIYVGINTGHLGFLQEIKANEIDILIKSIKDNAYNIDELYPLDVALIAIQNNKKYSLKFQAINEFVLREINLKTLKFEVDLDGEHLETFAGDGVLVSSAIGSTAYNLSSGGAIIHPKLKAIQLLPLSPLPTSKHYSNLNTSLIIPNTSQIVLKPLEFYKNKLRIQIDGEMYTFDSFNNIMNIKLGLSETPIKTLTIHPLNYPVKIREKFLDI